MEPTLQTKFKLRVLFGAIAAIVSLLIVLTLVWGRGTGSRTLLLRRYGDSESGLASGEDALSHAGASADKHPKVQAKLRALSSLFFLIFLWGK